MSYTNWTRNQSNDTKDIHNRQIEVGQTVIRAGLSDRTPYLEIRKVTRVEDGKVYLDDSKVALNYSGRVMILDKVTQFLSF